MSAPSLKALVTNLRFVCWIGSEDKFLYITNRLHNKPNRKKDNTSNIPSGTESMLRILRNIWRIQDGYGKGTNPHPNHLEDPKAKKFEKVVALVVETVVFASFDNAEEEEA